MSAPTSSISRTAQVSLVVAFHVGIALPLLGTMLGFAPETSTTAEKRAAAELPSLRPSTEEVEELGWFGAQKHALQVFPRRFDAYYADHFGYRAQLIRWNSTHQALWLGISPTDQVVIGKDGWLFYAGQRGIEQYRALDPFTDHELASWQRRLEEVHDWLADRGIPFVFLVAPAKPTIYPDKLPAHVVKVREESRLDQLLRHMRENTDVVVLDLRPAMQDARARQGDVYRPTDTHWNMRGALVAARELAREIQRTFPSVEPPDFDEFEAQTETVKGGDVALLMGLKELYTDEIVSLERKSPWPFEEVEIEESALADVQANEPLEREEARHLRRPFASVQEGTDYPRVVLFRDSYGAEMIAYVALTASRGVFYWQFAIDPEVVDREHADVVVQEVGERVLMFDYVPPNPAGVGRDFEVRKSFRDAGDVLVSLTAGDFELEDLEALEPAGNGGSPGLRLRPSGPAPRLVLRPTSPEACILRLELELSEPTTLDVGRGEEGLLRRRLTLEREIVYASVPASSEPVFIDLGTPAGEIRVLGLEVRALP